MVIFVCFYIIYLFMCMYVYVFMAWHRCGGQKTTDSLFPPCMFGDETQAIILGHKYHHPLSQLASPCLSERI